MDDRLAHPLRKAVEEMPWSSWEGSLASRQPPGPAVLERLERGFLEYQPLLCKWSRRVRLVGSAEPEAVTGHFVDSLTLWPLLDEVPYEGGILDVGSGAGFPGIPIALIREDLRVTLIESDGRKAAFLVQALARLNIKGAAVLNLRAKGAPDAEGIPRGDLVISRALMEPLRWLELGKPYLKRGGLLVAMLGRRAPKDAELAAYGQKLGLDWVGCRRGRLPGGEERVIAAWREVELS